MGPTKKATGTATGKPIVEALAKSHRPHSSSTKPHTGGAAAGFPPPQSPSAATARPNVNSALKYRSRSRSRSRTRSHTIPKARSLSGSSTGSMEQSTVPTEEGVTPLPVTPIKDSHANLLQHFKLMLQETAKQITSDLSRDMHAISRRTSDLEATCDTLSENMSAMSLEMKALQEENFHIQAKLEDMENRSRRGNLRFRGIPESHMDLQSYITGLCKDLVPEVSEARLEMERVHRALAPKKANGPPRDIIAKFLYFRSKEDIATAARLRSKTGPLIYHGVNYQVFADLAPSTILKRRAMRPALTILGSHHIAYKWGYPFRVTFQYDGRYHSATTPEEALDLLSKLGLSDTDSSQAEATTLKLTKRRRDTTDHLPATDLRSPASKLPSRPTP